MARGNTRWAQIAERVVYILDDDPKSREYLRAVFKLEGFQVESAQTVTQYLEATAQRAPDVVLMNAGFDNEGGIELLRTIASEKSGTAVIILQDGDTTRLTVEAMKAGAYDVFAQPFNVTAIVKSVLESLGSRVMLVNGMRGTKPLYARTIGRLTPREREVLDQLINGLTNKETGRALGISSRTVEVHRSRVMEKLGARNTADLLRLVLVQ
ncbi:DNA-binding response regulator [Youhaiella tibetensis]|uniref:Response regulator n=1 Tax=Paradevosia tibetensis TaxID=1447062 RepID=A0A5B9DPH6_9HYPH|nr:response regulator [Youhaiella tibetensis]QEE20438.1 response regulator [Youhaiella tibetensis]GGF24152.1 DNA-binding response regulator [Youhaiella tibetensis]